MERLDPQEDGSATMTPNEPPQPAAGLRTVSKFDHDLLTILRYLLGQIPGRQAFALIQAKQDRPRCLSRNCIELVKDTLSKGLVLHLTRIGGWRHESFLEREQPIAGRVWNRIPLTERKLVFGEPVLEFLIWLTTDSVDEKNDKWLSVRDLTAADEFFFAVAFDRLRTDPTVLAALRLRNAFSANPFCWLIAPGEFIGTGGQAPDFRPLFTGTRAAILECLQPWLTRHWISSERQKGAIVDWTEMQRVARGEAAMLSSIVEGAQAARRPDLALFILRTLSRLMRDRTPDANDWIGGLNVNPPTRLADRLAIQRDALAFLRQAEPFARWDRTARAVGYFDEGYAASQWWKEEYEAANGPEIAAKSKRALDQLEPLKT